MNGLETSNGYKLLLDLVNKDYVSAAEGNLDKDHDLIQYHILRPVKSFIPHGCTRICFERYELVDVGKMLQRKQQSL